MDGGDWCGLTLRTMGRRWGSWSAYSRRGLSRDGCGCTVEILSPMPWDVLLRWRGGRGTAKPEDRGDDGIHGEVTQRN